MTSRMFNGVIYENIHQGHIYPIQNYNVNNYILPNEKVKSRGQ